jgi:hypothetical protein
MPFNKAAVVRDAVYANASNGSQWYIAEVVAHRLNAHYAAPKAYAHIFSFIVANFEWTKWRVESCCLVVWKCWGESPNTSGIWILLRENEEIV